MSESRLVFSTTGDSICRGCHKPLKNCKCRSAELKPVQSKLTGIRISRESKGRKGKGVTLIKGCQGSEAELKKLAKRLKALCGSGGTVKGGVIEIQGDHREQLQLEMEKHFSDVKLSGG